MTKIKEIERRFLVKSIDPDIKRSPSKGIVQGYFETRPDISFRVRITDDTAAELTKKTGTGEERDEDNEEELPLRHARFMMDERIVDIVSKRRYLRDGWEIDFYDGVLTGLVKAEFESPIAGFHVDRPAWIGDWVEVTDSLTDRHLARLARDLMDSKVDKPIRDLLPKRIPHIVMTGGPCSGKSTAMAALRGEIGDLVHCVPEVATIVIEQVKVRPPVRDPVGMRKFQRTIYRVQRGFETISDLQALQDGKRALLTDRGTIDGSAYMDGGLEEFEKVCRTSVRHEYGQYDLVLCLAVPPKHVYDANKHNNPARKEGYQQAAALGEKIVDAWKSHPNFHLVDGQNWPQKLDAIRAVIGAFLAQH